jgi:hypothetical protein
MVWPPILNVAVRDSVDVLFSMLYRTLSSPWPFPGSDNTRKLACDGADHAHPEPANTLITSKPLSYPTCAVWGDTPVTHPDPLGAKRDADRSSMMCPARMVPPAAMLSEYCGAG